MRNSGAVGVEPEQQKLSGPDRWQLSLLGREVQGAEQAARPSQSRVRWCGPDGHPAAQLLTQQNRVPVSTFHGTPCTIRHLLWRLHVSTGNINSQKSKKLISVRDWDAVKLLDYYYYYFFRGGLGASLKGPLEILKSQSEDQDSLALSVINAFHKVKPLWHNKSITAPWILHNITL